jgi:diguanylate cyclase (GGDEF)-like protein
MTEATDLEPRAAAEVDVPRKLIAYAVAVGAVALGAALFATWRYPLDPLIGIGWPGLDPTASALGGMLVWIALGLAGSFWSRELPSGAVITFHMPFVVAGAVLGGPVVGAWMGIVSELELRELRRVPWYGTIGNHAVVALAGISAGLLADLARWLLGTSVASGDGIGFFVVGAVAAAGFVAVNFALVLPVIAMRGGMSLRAALHTYDAMLRATVVAEAVLAWLMAVTYLTVGWWAPAACVALIVVVWDAYERSEQMRHDPMTGLLNDKGFRPALAEAVREAHRAAREHALLVIDLDGFGKLNKDHGMHVGDEMIIATANRLRAAVRSTDVVARYNRAGDEFGVLLTGLPDASTAEMLARRIRSRLLGPTRVRGTDLQVSVGASVGVCHLDAASPATADEVQRTADRRMQHAKRHRLGVLAVDPEDLDQASA